jgi:hypothetical protein
MGKTLQYLFVYPPFLKGGVGGFRKRLKIPLFKGGLQDASAKKKSVHEW